MLRPPILNSVPRRCRIQAYSTTYYYYKLTGPLPSALKKDFKNSVKKRALVDPALQSICALCEGVENHFWGKKHLALLRSGLVVSAICSDEPTKSVISSHDTSWDYKKTRVLVLNCWKSEFFEIFLKDLWFV